jgi:hypothetical protein
MIRHLVHVHSYDQRPVKMSVTEKLERMSIRVSWEFVTLALE